MLASGPAVQRIGTRLVERMYVRAPGTVRRRFDVAGTADRIVLLNWAASNEARFANVARIDPEGGVIWRAELPGTNRHDCFVDLVKSDGVFIARTFSGHESRLDEEGRLIGADAAR